MDIPQEIYDLYNNTVSDFITKNFGVTCTLYYGMNRVQCPNCIFNSAANVSSGKYKAGGPMPFSQTVCPYCAGVGFKTSEQTEDIKLRVYFTKKDFIKIDIPVVAPNGLIQTIGFMSDMPKLQKAKEIVAHSSIDNYAKYRYQLVGEIMPWGMGMNDRKFCVAFWKRSP